MGIRIFKISEYNYRAEQEQFDIICHYLKNKFQDSEEEALFIGNINIEGVELDALLITKGGVRIIEFKNWGGHIIAKENGAWKADGMTIDGGAADKTPFSQVRLNKSRVTKGLKKSLGLDPKAISAVILFHKDCTFDKSQLSDTVKSWLQLCDNRALNTLLKGYKGEIHKDEIRMIPQKLGIEEFDIEHSPLPIKGNKEDYTLQTAVEYFQELRNSLKYHPDYSQIYTLFYTLFLNIINQNTANNKLHFGGNFPKTHYLLTEHYATKKNIKRTNETRIRLTKRSEATAEELGQWCYYDLRNLCEFIALIYKVEIPKDLRKLFPTEEKKINMPRPSTDYIRVHVEEWDNEYLYGISEEKPEGGALKIYYAQSVVYNNFDCTYLHEMLYKGAQLNIIRPREKEGIIYPEFIIFEPDYLVNISTISSCFTSYAESAMVNLINKLQPSRSSQAILLGNFASQLLDEQLHRIAENMTYKESVEQFWQSNATNLLTTPINSTFHDDAKKQKKNISKALSSLSELNPIQPKNFSALDGIVEPSFFSEMLGLQGRMDYLQSDFLVLIEQKSGKGEFPYNNYIYPTKKEEHYVQMLLYMLLIRYNFSEIYEQNNQTLHTFLLYSKYEEGLIKLENTPELIFRAIKVRNEIAYQELGYRRANRMRDILEDLTPEALNTKRTSNRLWEDYQKVQIESILTPIHEASELERDYYFRFLTFIANEHAIGKLGSKTKENSGFASTWHDTLEEKLQAGNIYDNLDLILPESTNEIGYIESVTLQFKEKKSNNMANFRIGDIVILYSYKRGSEPDARKTIVMRCSIEKIEANQIKLVFRTPQIHAKIFEKNKNDLWAIEHDFMDSSFSSLYRGMQSFLNAPKERKDLILLQRAPKYNEKARLLGEYGYFNELQQKIKQAKDLFLIIGPPGTGKTSFGMLDTLLEEYKEPDGTILVLSYTNRAVDEVCSKLVEYNQSQEIPKEGKINFIRLGSTLSCSKEYREYLLTTKAKNCKQLSELEEVFTSARVVVATTTAMNANIELLQKKEFSLAIIDEASQILEPHLIGILSAHKENRPSIKKFVLIGDHKQLPAVVQQDEKVSKVEESSLKEILLEDCRLSLFERLLKKYRKDSNVVYLLNRQGRMHRDIALFPNYTFYNNQLDVVPRGHQLEVLPKTSNNINGIDQIISTKRVAFIHADSPTNSISDKVNEIEANIIVTTSLRIYQQEYKKWEQNRKDDNETFDLGRIIGIIVPYRNQIATIRNRFESICIEQNLDETAVEQLRNITIDTVERYQGSQRKYILYGFTIQKYQQLKFLTNNVFQDIDGSIVDRKLNVAMTRAEEHLILIGNAPLLANNFTFYKLIEFIKIKQGYFEIPYHQYLSGEFNIATYPSYIKEKSQPTYQITKEFREAFDRHIEKPLKEKSTESWPERVLDNDELTNLETLGYGRNSYSRDKKYSDEGSITNEEISLLQCHYYMERYYNCSKHLFSKEKDRLSALHKRVNGRITFIEIGNGMATSGIAFAETFLKDNPRMVYARIEKSAEMSAITNNILKEMFSDDLHYRIETSLYTLSERFWESRSEEPSLIIINFSYLFSMLTQAEAERIANYLLEKIDQYPLNQYLFITQHSAFDNKHKSYEVFQMKMESETKLIYEEQTPLTYNSRNETKNDEFYYRIMSSI